jgi:hypothetical protein
MKDLDYAKDYQMYKPGKDEKMESYLPEKLQGKKYYLGKISKIKR